jgi:hypothetical protein
MFLVDPPPSISGSTLDGLFNALDNMTGAQNNKSDFIFFTERGRSSTASSAIPVEIQDIRACISEFGWSKVEPELEAALEGSYTCRSTDNVITVTSGKKEFRR